MTHNSVAELSKDFMTFSFTEGESRTGELSAERNTCLITVMEELWRKFNPKEFSIELVPGCGGCPRHTDPIHHKITIRRPVSDDWTID